MDDYQEQEFDKFAQDYRDIHTETVKKLSEFGSEYFAEYKVQTIKDSLNFKPQNILDLGCGDGTSCEYLRKHFPDAKIFGIDISSQSIEAAKGKQIENCNFESYDGNKIPYESESFDLILVACVFHHVKKENHFDLLKELKRVLKTNGKLFIFEHNPINPFTRKVFNDCIFDRDAELISSISMKNTTVQSGFLNVKINYTLFFPRYNVFKKLFSLEKYLKRFFIGAQYYIEASKD